MQLENSIREDFAFQYRKLVCSYHQYIKILLVCLSVRVCVTDVGVAVTNLRVVCKIITCVPAVTENYGYKSFSSYYMY